jgi:hypothetical protein
MSSVNRMLHTSAMQTRNTFEGQPKELRNTWQMIFSFFSPTPLSHQSIMAVSFHKTKKNEFFVSFRKEEEENQNFVIIAKATK